MDRLHQRRVQSTVKVLYWNAITKDHPEYFAGDKVHLKPAGQDFYVAQLMSALGRS